MSVSNKLGVFAIVVCGTRNSQVCGYSGWTLGCLSFGASALGVAVFEGATIGIVATSGNGDQSL